MGRSIWIWKLGIFATILALVSVVHAQGKAGKPSAEARARAREAYGEGQKLFEAEKYEQAKASFEEAFEAIPNPVVLVSIAECQKRLGEAAEAVATFERYLEMKPDAKDRASVEEKIEEIKNLPATLEIFTDPPGAAVRIDGEDTGKSTPAEIELAPGEHSVELTVSSGESVTRTVNAEFGKRHELRVELGAEEAIVDPFAEGPAAVQEPEQEPETRTDEGPSIVPWVVIGVGGAALVAGTVMGVMALAKESDFNDKPTEDSADAGERLALFTDVAFGVGAVAVITGLVLLLTEEEPRGEDEMAGGGSGEASRVLLAPAVLNQGAGVSARVRF